MYRYPRRAKLLMLAIALPLTACVGSSVAPPPIVDHKMVTTLPPAALLEYPVPPAVNATTRDQERQLLLDLAAWGANLRARLDALKAWQAKQTP